MFHLLKIAIRNVLRNKRRSLITMSAVAFGLGALIFLRGFIFGAQTQMVENITTTLTSDAQIVPSALENIYNTNSFIEKPGEIRSLLRADPRVRGFTERVVAGGIVSSATNSMATFVVGVEPDEETAIGNRRNLSRGKNLGVEDATGAAIGEKMREVLGVEIGEKIVVTAQDYYGALAGGAYTLVGTFETGNDQIDNGTVILLRETAQELLSLGDRVSKIPVVVRDRREVGAVVADLRTRLPDKTLKVLTWEELIPMMSQLIRFQNGMIFVIMMIVLTVVAAGILNTLMMSIVERVREFGLMMALGTRPGQVIALVMTESFLLSVVGALLGTTLGIAAVLYFAGAGIDLSGFVSSTLKNFLIGSVVHPRIDWFYLAVFEAVVLISNLIVSFYPAWRASRLDPIEAMRQVG